MTFTEFEAWVKTELVEDQPDCGEELHKSIGDKAIKAAYNDAKDIAPGEGEALRWREFRMSNVYLIIYGCIIDAFKSIGGGETVNAEEWAKGGDLPGGQNNVSW